MAELFDLEGLWKDNNFEIAKGVLDPRAVISGKLLGYGLIYYPHGRTVIHRIVGTGADESILAKTRVNARYLWNPGEHIEIYNESRKPTEVFRIELRFTPELVNIFSHDAVGAATAHLLHGDWASEFQASVRKDVDAIGALATQFASGLKLDIQSINRATRAKEDLEFKLSWFAASLPKSKPVSRRLWTLGIFGSGGSKQVMPSVSGMIKVTVNTEDQNGNSVKGCEVFTNAWPDGQDLNTASTFPQLSTPTTKILSVGKYAMWTEKNKQSGPVRAIDVGSILQPAAVVQTVDLLAP